MQLDSPSSIVQIANHVGMAVQCVLISWQNSCKHFMKCNIDRMDGCAEALMDMFMQTHTDRPTVQEHNTSTTYGGWKHKN